VEVGPCQRSCGLHLAALPQAEIEEALQAGKQSAGNIFLDEEDESECKKCNNGKIFTPFSFLLTDKLVITCGPQVMQFALKITLPSH
jgi:hypothetical protein